MTLERLRASLADRYRLERELGQGGLTADGTLTCRPLWSGDGARIACSSDRGLTSRSTACAVSDR